LLGRRRFGRFADLGRVFLNGNLCEGLSQPLDTRASYFRLLHVQPTAWRKTRKEWHRPICDLCGAQAERLEVYQGSQVLQPDIADSARIQRQLSQFA
jgi:hypothetical protein